MQKIYKVWVPGLPHVLNQDLNPGYKALNSASQKIGEELEKFGVKRILYYSTQWLSVLGQSVQTRKNLKGTHVDENWYNFEKMKFDFNVDQELSSKILKAVGDAGFQARAVDYEGFPIDTGTIVADSLLNTNKIPTSMFSCCVYSDYNETKKLGGIISKVIQSLPGATAVVVSSGLSGRYFTTEIDYREDHIRSIADDAANKNLLKAFESGNWQQVDKIRDEFCSATKADMGLKALAFLQGVGLEGEALNTRAYQAIYGTGAAVLTSW